jgi:16S rRNA (uracil1498-N3)-methyltransferase
VLHVLRGRPGDSITLFDGSGDEFEGLIAETGRREVRVKVVSRRAVDRELPIRLMLGVALPKGERQRFLVEKLVELGTSALIPLSALRSVAQPGGSATDRLGRYVVEASKQCGRNRLMEILPARGFCDFLAAAPVRALRMVAHPSPSPQCLSDALSIGGEVWAAIGPEGGFTSEEIEKARAANWRLVDLGPRILRVETAAVALAAWAALSAAADRTGALSPERGPTAIAGRED